MGFNTKGSLNFKERESGRHFYLFTDSPCNKQYIEIYLRTETTEESKPEVTQREGKVLVEKITQELAHAVI